MAQTSFAAWGDGTYRAAVPTEAQIRDAAQRLGHADENGDYPKRLRSKLAAAVALAAQEPYDDPGEASIETTAEQLARFAAELTAAGFTPGTARDRLVVAAGEHLLETAGLLLKPREETTP